jgi:hypothetical protein
MASRARPEDVIPDGLDPPAAIPPEIFRAGVATFLEQPRFDIVTLASTHGLSRATIYRKLPGGRERLLSDVVWYLTRLGFARAIRSARGRSGARRLLKITRTFHEDLVAAAPFQRILDTERELALRIMSSWEGPVRPGLIKASEALIAEERRLGALGGSLDDATLAYATVRLGESFLYDAALARTDPDVDRHIAVLERLFT